MCLPESVARDSDTPAYQAVDEVFAAFDYLNEATGKSDTIIKRIADIVEAFYSHLVSRRLVGTNPAAGLDDEFKWATNTGGDTPALSTEHVRGLYDAADDLEKELLVVALAGWGLRTNEVPALHIDQIEGMTEDTPRIEFDERKNGPGSVSILYGIDVLQERLVQMSDQEDWSRYLFPSTRSDSDHVS